MIKLPFDSCNIPLQRSLRTFDLDNLISNEGGDQFRWKTRYQEDTEEGKGGKREK